MAGAFRGTARLPEVRYWLSLRSAPESPNDTAQTVYIPKDNQLSVQKLRKLMARFSRREVINYEA